MFRTLGRFVIRHKYLVVALWVLAAIWTVTQAPSLSEKSVSETSDLLPRNAPSILAQAALA